MSIPQGNYTPPAIKMRMSELRNYLNGERAETRAVTRCRGCSLPIRYSGKWCIRNNHLVCVPTNEYRCNCGHTTTPGELMQYAAIV